MGVHAPSRHRCKSFSDDAEEIPLATVRSCVSFVVRARPIETGQSAWIRVGKRYNRLPPYHSTDIAPCLFYKIKGVVGKRLFACPHGHPPNPVIKHLPHSTASDWLLSSSGSTTVTPQTRAMERQSRTRASRST